MRNLLIIESAGKIKKLKSILGSDWDVKASIGHTALPAVMRYT
jgi:DNA topoisomerase-1